MKLLMILYRFLPNHLSLHLKDSVCGSKAYFMFLERWSESILVSIFLIKNNWLFISKKQLLYYAEDCVHRYQFLQKLSGFSSMLTGKNFRNTGFHTGKVIQFPVPDNSQYKVYKKIQAIL